VVIALPILHQPQAIRAALAAGKHVLSEKPIASDLAEASELIQWHAENAAGLVWSVAENYRYNKHYEHAAEVVRRGTIGKLSFFTYQMLAGVKPGDKYFETEWRKTPEYQGGFLLDGGVHHAAAIRMVTSANGGGEVVKLAAFTRQVQPHLPPKDTFHATLQLADGTQGTFAMSFGSSRRFSEFTVVGEKGSLSVNGFSVSVFDAEGKEVEKKDFPAGPSPGVHAEVAAFAQAVRSGKAEERASPLEALRDLALVETILDSGDQGGLTLPVPSF